MQSILAAPITPQKSVKIEHPETADGCRHLALKRLPAHLAVGDDFQSGIFLQRDRRVDSVIFNLCELAGSEITVGEVFLSGKQFGWPEQASDNVGMNRNHNRDSIKLEPHTRSRENPEDFTCDSIQRSEDGDPATHLNCRARDSAVLPCRW